MSSRAHPYYPGCRFKLFGDQEDTVKTGQIGLIAFAVAAVAAIALLAGHHSSSKSPSSHASNAPAGAVVVTVASSPEKLSLLQDLASAYNGTHPTVSGKAAFVQIKSASSGDEVLAIENGIKHQPGADEPAVWSPASSLWGRLLDYQADSAVVAGQNPSIVHSPLVIAMWEPMARALGWPKTKLGFKDLLRLTREPRGWSAYGHPEWGAFKLVHTNPSISTSGLEAVTDEYYAATGKKEGLTIADVDRPSTQAQIKGLESSIVHYGDTTLFISNELKRNGPGYASAVAMEETTLVGFNQARGGQPKLVGIYPSEGTFYSDSPYMIVNAPWVSGDQKQAAHQFQQYIASHLSAQTAAKFGFRLPTATGAPPAPVNAANGADPALPPRILGLPDPRVLGHIEQAWLGDRKPADIELVLDTSGSMSANDKLEHAKVGLKAFLGQLQPQDRVGLITFSSDSHQLLGIEPIGKARGPLTSAIGGLFPDGETRLYDTTAQAVQAVQQLGDHHAINAVVLLTDGQDTTSSTALPDLLSQLSHATGAEGRSVRVFTIAYGSDADQGVLGQISEATGGKSYSGDTGNIVSVYRSISSFF